MAIPTWGMHWERGFVCSKVGKVGTFEVDFIDSGRRREVIDGHRVKRLEPHFQSYACPTFQVSLADVLPLQGLHWADDFNTDFNRLLLDHFNVLLLKVVGVWDESLSCHAKCGENFEQDLGKLLRRGNRVRAPVVSSAES